MTDTEKWKRPWFDALPTIGKLVWLYLLDSCDHTGVWPANFRLMSAMLNEKITQAQFEAWFGDKVRRVDDKYFIPSFVEFQYPNGLNPDNRAHKGVISIVEKVSSYIKEAPSKPLQSPSQGAKEKVKDKDLSSLKGDAPQNAALAQQVDACGKTWIETLAHWGIDRDALFASERMAIARAISATGSGAEEIDKALYGIRFEPKTEKYNPANYPDLNRALDPAKRSKWISLAAKHKPATPKYYRPEEDASA